MISREEFILDGIATFIENNYSDNVTRDRLAKRACMNKCKFSKVFNKRFGRNIKDYLNNIRMKKAAELLDNRDLRITDIALSVGFGSIEHFTRVFKKTYNLSPREYRKNPIKLSTQYSLWNPD